MQVTDYTPRAWVEISTEALRHNLSKVREFTPNAKVMAVIKADAYGHGMELVATSLQAADEFAVTDLCDVARLREAGIDHKISTLSEGVPKQTIDSQTRLTIFEKSQIESLQLMQLDCNLDVWVKVDTGMGRLGFLPEQIPMVLAQLGAHKAIRKIGLMTHLANADVPQSAANTAQLDTLRRLLEEFDFDQISVLNSGGVCAFPEYAHDVVRPGIMLYGASPLFETSAVELGLKPAMTFKSRLIAVRDLAAGSSIGYGGSAVLERASRIGIVACGYGDGYPRHAPSGTPVLINGQLSTLIGRVSMDMIAVDLADQDAQVGDQAILWGQGNPIETIAQAAGTISYELMCGITQRVERVVLNG